MKKFEVLIIGGGPAAITICKILGQKKQVGIIRPEDYSMIYCAMPYVIEKILPIQKTFKKDELVTDTGAQLIRDKVSHVDLEAKIVTTAKGQIFTYDKIVITTGALPVLPKIQGYDLKGVSTFKTEEDLKNIQSATENGTKKVVVIGAGAIGIELAQAFNKIGIKTHIVDAEAHILPNMMDYEMVEAAQDELIASGMSLHLNNKVIALKGKKFVEEVVLEDGTAIQLNDMDEYGEADTDVTGHGLVVFAVGMRPNVELFKDTGLEIGTDGIIVNEKMETSMTDVYAAGDCVQFKSGITNEIISGKLATNAVPMGRVVAKNLLGKNKTYKGFFNGAATKVENFFIGGSGISEKLSKNKFDVTVGYSELTTTFPIMPEAKKVKIKLITDKKTKKIIGGQVVSGSPSADKVDLITMAIQHGLTIDDLMDFSYSSQPYQSFFPANNLLVNAAENAEVNI